VTVEIRQLIRQMSGANPLWGAPRIHGELLKLGNHVPPRQRGALCAVRSWVDCITNMLGLDLR
jgi:hypothetical protein